MLASEGSGEGTRADDRPKDLATKPGHLPRRFHVARLRKAAGAVPQHTAQKSDPRFRGSPSLSATGLNNLASMREIAQRRSRNSLNPPKASSRQCPLPSRASSIDLEHPEAFMKLDHCDLRFGVRRSCRRSVGPCGASSCCTPTMEGRVKRYQKWMISSSAVLASADPGSRPALHERRATMTHPHHRRPRARPRCRARSR